MWVHNFNPIAISIGPFDIRWYGIMYVLTFVIVYYYLQNRVRKEKIHLSEEQVDNLMIWMTIAMIIGARLFEVVFWNLSYYLAYPLKVFAIWGGGLSFHGGLVGIVIAAIVLIRRYKLNFLQIADIVIVPAALGQALGRVGNFINGELYGHVTNVWWAVKFPGAEGWRHPSQLYEVAYDLVIFAVLFYFRDKKIVRKWPHGILLVIFLLLYPVFRFITEFFREAHAYVGPLTMGQVLNIFMFGFGVWLLIRIRREKKHHVHNEHHNSK